MSPQSTVLIAAPDLLPLLQHAQTSPGELLVFSDIDASQALEAITEHRPGVVAVEQFFAATPRGIALINRIKADPVLSGCEVRIVSQDGTHRTVSAPVTQGGVFAMPVAIANLPLDATGTRRAQRFKIAGGLEILVDGNPASLVDLSSIGAQVLSANVLKPNQRVRVSISDERGTTRFNASIAWASFEIPPKTSPRYRAGLEFIDADTQMLSGYCLKYQA